MNRFSIFTRKNPFYFITFGILILLFTLLSPPLQAQTGTPCGKTPSDVMIMLDRTSSVSEFNRQKEAEAAKGLVTLLLKSDKNRVAVGRFGAGECEEHWPPIPGVEYILAESLQQLTGDPNSLKQAIDAGMTSYNCNGTNLEDAINIGSSELETGTNPEQILILISDGDPNRPFGETEARLLALEAAEKAKNSNIRLFTIAFDSSEESDQDNRDLLARMASNYSINDAEGAVSDEARDTENRDGDDFFIAPTGEDLDYIFQKIGDQILCDDGDPCTKDICDSSESCRHIDNGTCNSLDFADDETKAIPNTTEHQEVEVGQPSLNLQGSGYGCSFHQSDSSEKTFLHGIIFLPLIFLPLIRNFLFLKTK